MRPITRARAADRSDGFLQFLFGDPFFEGVRHVDRAGAKQKRLAPRALKRRDIGRVRHDRGLKPRT